MPIKMSTDDIRAVYQQGEEAVVSLITVLIDKLNTLESEVNRLKGIIDKDSHNSSKPPSSDFNRPAPKSLRKKGKKKMVVNKDIKAKLCKVALIQIIFSHIHCRVFASVEKCSIEEHCSITNPDKLQIYLLQCR